LLWVLEGGEVVVMRFRTRSRRREIIKTFKTCFRWAPAIAIVNCVGAELAPGKECMEKRVYERVLFCAGEITRRRSDQIR
jgi:hypothetical protein